MRRGFTMIELIFVIVIIGILAVIAIPKLSATRDDAKITTELQNLSTCVQDLGAQFTATGTEGTATSLTSCKNLKCFKISGDGDTDGNITVDNSSATDAWCTDARNLADKRDLNGTHVFGGSHIVVDN